MTGYQKWGWGENMGYYTSSGQAKVYQACKGCGADCPATVTEPLNIIKQGCLDYSAANGQIWRGPAGYSCGAYHHGRWCKYNETSGTWDNSGAMKYYSALDTYKNLAIKDGEQVEMSPLEACCSCGGGSLCPSGWTPPAGTGCAREFVYNSKAYSGCTLEDGYGTGWCSYDVEYQSASKWDWCEPC